MFDLVLHRDDKRPLYLQLADKIATLASSGALKPGTRLPGSRALADNLSLSRSTVIAALDELCARGVIEPRRGSGHVIVGVRTLKNDSPRFDMSHDLPKGDLCPTQWLGKVTCDLFDAQADFDPQGEEDTRAAFARHAAGRGVVCDLDELWLNSGGRQGLAAALAALRSQGVRACHAPDLSWDVIGDACRAEGLKLCRFRDEPKKLGPGDVVYLNTTFSNPTGATLSKDERHHWGQRAQKEGFWIIEDDAYADLRWRGEALSALWAYGGGQVIYMASLSQTFNPGLRIGYLVADKRLKKGLNSATTRRFGPLSSLLQRWASDFLKSKASAKALEQVRSVGRRRQAQALKELGEWIPHPPEGGTYLWLPTAQSATFAADALALGVKVAPGEQFGSSKGVRVSFAGLQGSELDEACTLLAALKRKEEKGR